MENRKNINKLEYFTNNQAQGSNDRAFSINKQVKTSTGSRTSNFFQLQQNYVLLQRVIKCPPYNEFQCSIYAANEEVELILGFKMLLITE